MYQLILTNQAKKELQRLDKPVIKTVMSILEGIAENPHAGEPLRGDLSHLKKWSFVHMGIDYRVAYQIFEAYVEVRVLKIGTRENFYDDLKRKR